MMDKMIAFCGLTCTECPAFIATQKNDNKEREKVAKDYSFRNQKKSLKKIDSFLVIANLFIREGFYENTSCLS